VPSAGFPPDIAAQLADCSPTEKCVPDAIVTSLGSFTLESCRAVGNVAFATQPPVAVDEPLGGGLFAPLPHVVPRRTEQTIARVAGPNA